MYEAFFPHAFVVICLIAHEGDLKAQMSVNGSD